MPVKLYAFLGPHASGRSTIITQLIGLGIPYIPTYTTKVFMRREDYKNSIYKTVKREEFDSMEFIAKYSYQGSEFGLKKDEVLNALSKNRVNAVLLGIKAIPQLRKFIKREFETVYIMADQASLIERMLKLNYSNDEIKYYIEYAESHKEFDQWKTTDYIVKNTRDISRAFEQVLSIMGLMELRSQAEIDALLGVKSAFL